MDGVDDLDQDPLQRGVPKVKSSDGITVLGAPVGWREYVREKIAEKIEKVRLITELLRHLKDSHSEFVLLRSCLSLPKVMFLLRALDSRILGYPVTDNQWAQGVAWDSGQLQITPLSLMPRHSSPLTPWF